MTDAEIELLKQLEQDIRQLEEDHKALQNQILGLLGSNMAVSTALLTILQATYPRARETQSVKSAIGGIQALKNSIVRRIEARQKR